MIATIATIAEKKQNFSDRSDNRGHFVFFTAAHFNLVAASISNFLTAAIFFFMFFFQQNLSPLLFISRSTSFPVIQVNVDIKIY